MDERAVKRRKNTEDASTSLLSPLELEHRAQVYMLQEQIAIQQVEIDRLHRIIARLHDENSMLQTQLLSDIRIDAGWGP